jgi:hypothetical protein
MPAAKARLALKNKIKPGKNKIKSVSPIKTKRTRRAKKGILRSFKNLLIASIFILLIAVLVREKPLLRSTQTIDTKPVPVTANQAKGLSIPVATDWAEPLPGVGPDVNIDQSSVQPKTIGAQQIPSVENYKGSMRLTLEVGGNKFEIPAALTLKVGESGQVTFSFKQSGQVSYVPSGIKLSIPVKYDLSGSMGGQLQGSELKATGNFHNQIKGELSPIISAMVSADLKNKLNNSTDGTGSVSGRADQAGDLHGTIELQANNQKATGTWEASITNN